MKIPTQDLNYKDPERPGDTCSVPCIAKFKDRDTGEMNCRLDFWVNIDGAPYEEGWWVNRECEDYIDYIEAPAGWL